MPRLLLFTASELTRDPRARRQVAAAAAHGYDVFGVSDSVSQRAPAALDGATIVRVGGRARASTGTGGMQHASTSALARELRGVYRLARLAVRTALLVRAALGVPRPDVVHANDFETLPAAWIVARRRRARLVYDAHELYSEFDPDPPRLYRRALVALESLLARRAVVVTVSDSLADELARRLELRRRPTVVLNAPPLADAEPTAPTRPLRVVYQGSFGTGRPLAELLDAVAHTEDVHLTIRAVHVDSAVIESAVAEHGVGAKVDVAPPVSPDAVMSGLAGHHVGLVFDRPVTLNGRLTLPNKAFEYMMAGLAIVVPRLPELARLVDEERVGITFEPGDGADLASALERLAGDHALLAATQARARAAAVARFNAEAQAGALVALWAGQA